MFAITWQQKPLPVRLFDQDAGTDAAAGAYFENMH
jgi:hypothetical protein